MGITYTVQKTDGDPAAFLPTTSLLFTFSADPGNLEADDITISGRIGAAVKGALSGNGTTRTLDISVTKYGSIVVAINANNIETGGKSVTVNKGWSGVTVQGLQFRGIAYGTRFVAVGTGGIAYSDNGMDWAVVTARLPTSSFMGAAWNGSRFAAVGHEGKIVYSNDGKIWTAARDSTFGDSTINSIVWGNDRFVAVGDKGK